MKIRSKKEIEENKLKRKKVLKILKRVLAVLIYLWALILTIGLIVGSCSNGGSKKQQLRKGLVDNINDFAYTYVLKTTGQTSYGIEYQREWGSYYGFDADRNYGSSQSDITEYETLEDTYMVIDGNYSLCSSLRIRFRCFGSGSNYYYRLLNLAIFMADESGFYIVEKVDNSYNNYMYNLIGYGVDGNTEYESYLLSANELQSSHILPYFYYQSTPYGAYDFSFGQYITPNIIAGVQSNQVACYSVAFDVNQAFVSFQLDLPFFTAGNNVYNRITLQFATDYYEDAYNVNIGFVSYVYDNVAIGSSEMPIERGLGICINMLYSNTITQNSSVVCYRESYIKEFAGLSRTFYTRSWSWVNNEYRRLRFLETPSVNQQNKLIALNDGYDTSIDKNIPSTTTIFDVFSLLTGAFASIVPLLNIAIIPGLTIGVLLFMPFVITIIVLVVRMVKK